MSRGARGVVQRATQQDSVASGMRGEVLGQWSWVLTASSQWLPKPKQLLRLLPSGGV